MITFEMASFWPLPMLVFALPLIFSSIIHAEGSGEDTPQGPIVACKSGTIRGKRIEILAGRSVNQFLGIPYAEAPVGELRFAVPKPIRPWSGIKEATKYGPSCPQQLINMKIGGNMTWNTKGFDMSENCLSLNVFVPADTKSGAKKAVMVWIYSGGFSLGATKDYNGTVLSALNDIVFVSVNYRVGVFGFFNIPGSDVKGNYGMYDQILALKWVQENIAYFGGDSGRVTIFGLGSGGMAVSLLLLSPLTTGLFQRVIAQSGSSASPFCCHRVRDTKTVEAFAAAAQCNMDDQLIDCLRKKTMEELLSASYNFTMPGKTTFPYDIAVPVVDGELLPDWPKTMLSKGRFQKADVMLGFTRDESSSMVLYLDAGGAINGTSRETLEKYIRHMASFTTYDNQLIREAVLFQYIDQTAPNNRLKMRKALGDIPTDYAFHAPAIFEANALSRSGNHPFVYSFSHHPKYSLLPEWTGAFHAADLMFSFGEPVARMQLFDAFPLVSGFNDMERGLSVFVMKMWTNFAKYGDPNQPDDGHDLVSWPKYRSSEEAYLNIALEPSVMFNLNPRRMAFWNDFIPKLMNIEPEASDNGEKKLGKDEL